MICNGGSVIRYRVFVCLMEIYPLVQHIASVGSERALECRLELTFPKMQGNYIRMRCLTMIVCMY